MHGSILREILRNSEMDYSFKITRVTKGVYEQPCQPGKGSDGGDLKGCETQRRSCGVHPDDWVFTGNEWCFRNCNHPIDVSLLSEKQIETYLTNRSSEKQKTDYVKHPENEPFYHAVPKLNNRVTGVIFAH
ncbi:MAG: hypothetical protein ABIE55_02560 [Candidatus Aenigmatarchaeota archaeon]